MILILMVELPEEVSEEAAVKGAGEAEDSEEGRAGAVAVKAEAGEATAVPLKAKARRKVFSRLAASEPPLSTSLSHHISTKKFVTPPVLVAGHHHHSSVFEPSFELNLPVQNLQHQNSKLAPISRVCLTSKIHNRYLSPKRYFQGFSIKNFNIDTGLK